MTIDVKGLNKLKSDNKNMTCDFVIRSLLPEKSLFIAL